jgi:hypothetical protein
VPGVLFYFHVLIVILSTFDFTASGYMLAATALFGMHRGHTVHIQASPTEVLLLLIIEILLELEVFCCRYKYRGNRKNSNTFMIIFAGQKYEI